MSNMYILSLFFGRGLPSSLFQTQQKLRQFFSFLCFSYEIYRRKVGEEQVTGGWTGSLSLAATRVLLFFPFLLSTFKSQVSTWFG